MGKNKLQRFADIAGYPHVFQYPFSVLKENGFGLRGSWGEKFFGNNNPIVLELGCGKGEYTVGLAEMFPEKNFIGVDIKGARIWGGAKESLQKGLKNVAFLRTTIELLPYFFSENEVSEIWITFPDPQMKRVRRRLTSTTLISLYNKILQPDGIIHLKCDSPFLYRYTTEMIKVNNFITIKETDDLYNSGIADEILQIRTFYEQQWLERGFSIKYICFKCNQNQNLVEPKIEIEPDSYRSFNRSRRSNQTKKEKNDNIS